MAIRDPNGRLWTTSEADGFAAIINMSDEWPVKRQYSRKTRDGFLVVTAGLHQLGGNRAPYFSVTSELWDSEGWYRNGQGDRCRAAGAMHEAILRAFPKLRPIVDLHLAYDDGEPMHAQANAWHFYSQGDLEAAARTLRVSIDELPVNADEETFAAFVDEQRLRWRKEAQDAIAWLQAS